MIRLGKIIWLCSTATLFCVTCSSAGAQGLSPTETLDWYRNRGDYLVPEFRKELRKGLSSADRMLEEQIQYDVVWTWNANAQAIHRNGVSRTGLGAGLLVVLDWVSTAMAIDAEFHKRQCASEYITSLTSAISQNSTAAAGIGSFTKIGSPFAFAHDKSQICSGITISAFRANHRADDLRELWIAGSVEFIMAHELGHHVLGHTASKPKNYPESRERETAADKFAFKTMAGANVNPIFAMPMVILWSKLEGFSIEGESTHPAGIRRMRALVAAANEVVNSDPELKAALRRNKTQEQWDKFVSTLDEQLSVLEQF
jgi:hypothetical protein